MKTYTSKYFEVYEKYRITLHVICMLFSKDCLKRRIKTIDHNIYVYNSSPIFCY